MRAICDIAAQAVLYCDDLTDNVGTGRVAVVLDEDMAAAARHGLPMIWDGDDTITADLGPLKIQAQARIDREAEAFCQTFVTPGETQMMRYKRKEDVARAWLADNETPVPGLQIEAAAMGVTVAELVSLILGLADQWNWIMDLVDAARVAAKTGVAAATTVADIAVAASVDWPGVLS
jgi:hypothetical protein